MTRGVTTLLLQEWRLPRSFWRHYGDVMSIAANDKALVINDVGTIPNARLVLALVAVVQRARTKLRGRELSPGLPRDRQKY